MILYLIKVHTHTLTWFDTIGPRFISYVRSQNRDQIPVSNPLSLAATSFLPSITSIKRSKPITSVLLSLNRNARERAPVRPMTRDDVARHGSDGWFGGVEDMVALPPEGRNQGIKESKSTPLHEPKKI